MSVRAIELGVQATPENFDETAYLIQNGDVARAVKDGMFGSGWDHFVTTGRTEGRLQRASNSVAEARERKLRKLRPHLRPDMAFRERDGRLDFLTRRARKETGITETENVSANGYDEEMHKLVEAYADGLILDCGAGRRDLYYENVVNYEIVAYDSTDILGVGEHLPFEDETFDAVFSIAVLEHVRDPFRCAAEIARVLKRGGRLYCNVPFLQPLHGYPHHYFNATPQGARRLFEDYLSVESVTVPEALHPVWALNWIAASWSAGLDDETRHAFLEMRVRELLAAPTSLLHRSFAARLSEEKRFELATGTVVTAVKKNATPKLGASGAGKARASWWRAILRRA